MLRILPTSTFVIIQPLAVGRAARAKRTGAFYPRAGEGMRVMQGSEQSYKQPV